MPNLKTHVAGAVKGKVWKEGKNGERDLGETRNIPIFFSHLTRLLGPRASRKNITPRALQN